MKLKKTVLFFIVLFYCFSLFSGPALAVSDSEINKRLQEVENNNKNLRSDLTDEELERVLNYLEKRYSEIGGKTKEEKYFNTINLYKKSKISFIQIVSFVMLTVLFIFLFLIIFSDVNFFSKIRSKIEVSLDTEYTFWLLFAFTLIVFGIFITYLLASLYTLATFYF